MVKILICQESITNFKKVLFLPYLVYRKLSILQLKRKKQGFEKRVIFMEDRLLNGLKDHTPMKIILFSVINEITFIY